MVKKKKFYFKMVLIMEMKRVFSEYYMISPGGYSS